MSSRRVFRYSPYEYDPYNYYYSADPYNYYVYGDMAKTVSSSTKQKPKAAPPAMSAEKAAVKIQAAARSFLARKAVEAVRRVDRHSEHIRVKLMEPEVQAFLAADSQARTAGVEVLMKLLLLLDGVHGARGYRGRIAKRVLALIDVVDALDPNKPLTPMAEEAGVDASDEAAAVPAVEMAEESVVPVLELEDAAERGGETESIKTAVHMRSQVEVEDAMAAAGEPGAQEPKQGAAKGEEHTDETEQEAVPPDANDVDEPADSDAEGEWEMVPEEENEHTAPVTATSDDDQEPPRKEEPASQLETLRTASAGAASDDDVDASKLMQMVAMLCEQNAKQCVVIGALTERVDALERTVRRMEDAESRRHAKSLSTEGDK